MMVSAHGTFREVNEAIPVSSEQAAGGCGACGRVRLRTVATEGCVWGKREGAEKVTSRLGRRGSRALEPENEAHAEGPEANAHLRREHHGSEKALGMAFRAPAECRGAPANARVLDR